MALGQALGQVLQGAKAMGTQAVAQAGGRDAIIKATANHAKEYAINNGPRAIFNAAGGDRIPILSKAFGAVDNARIGARNSARQAIADEAREKAKQAAQEEMLRAKEEAKRNKEEARARDKENKKTQREEAAAQKLRDKEAAPAPA